MTSRALFGAYLVVVFGGLLYFLLISLLK